jgi:hypothetical protein
VGSHGKDYKPINISLSSVYLIISGLKGNYGKGWEKAKKGFLRDLKSLGPRGCAGSIPAPGTK